MTGSPFNTNNRDDPIKPAIKASPQKQSPFSPVLLAGIAVAIIAILVIAIVVVYQFAQQQEDRQKITEAFHTLTVKQAQQYCAQFDFTQPQYLDCINGQMGGLQPR
jgi:uncharacterized protein HemX